MKLNVFISTYTYIYNGIYTNNSGPVLPLKAFFSKRAKKVYLLEQPLPGSDFTDLKFTRITDGKELKPEYKNFFFSNYKKRLKNMKTYMTLKLRDFWSNFYFFWKYRREFKSNKIQLFIALECVNAIAGIILKKLGLVDKVVYYIFDWAPDRFHNKIFNWFYIQLDKIAAYNSDFTWNITYTIGEARVNILGFDPKKLSPQLYVPYSVGFKEDAVKEDKDVDPNLIVYSGGLISENGPDLLLKAFKIVARKHPQAKLLIIGGGDMEEELRKYISEHSLQDRVNITGYIADEQKIVDLQCKSAIGVAPYPIVKGSRKPFGDVIKIRMYFACGLVTVSTPVPPVSKEITAEKLGITTKTDKPEEIAEAIISLLENKKELLKLRANVIKKAKTSSWSNTFSNALNEMKSTYVKK